MKEKMGKGMSRNVNWKRMGAVAPRLKEKGVLIFGMYVVLAVALFLVLFSSFAPVATGYSDGTVIVKTNLTVGAVAPDVLNISINDGAAITLTPNATTTVVCQAYLQDWNNDTDIYLVNATLYDVNNATLGDAPDANNLYTNSSCVIDLDASNSWDNYLEDDWHAVANCSFEVEYYANPSTWNCSVYAEDKDNRTGTNQDSGTIDPLLAVGLPDFIDYGIVNSTDVSGEQTIPIENMGNVPLDLNIDGYAEAPQDNKAMNCSKGIPGSQYIPIYYQKYNLTLTNDPISSLAEFDQFYKNMTSIAPTFEQFDLPQRLDTRLGATKDTFFRIYVPKGVAGTCEGNIQFAATADQP